MPVFEEPETRCITTYDSVKKIWSGIRTKPKYEPNYSIGTAVLESLLRDPEQICQICHHNGKIYTNKEIACLSIRVAHHFQHLGIPQMEMIGIVAGNTDYLAPLVFGAMLCGLTICPMDPTLEKEIIKSAYEKTRPTIFFTVGSEYEKVKQCLQEIDINGTIYTLNNHMRGVPEITEFLQRTETEKDFQPQPLQDGYNQIVAVLRSSGTSGSSKSVCVTYASLLHTFRPKFDSDTIFLRNTTIYWISGLSRLVGCCLQKVTSIIDERGFKSSSVPEIMDKYKVTFMYSTPHLLIDILGLPNVDKIDFSSLRQFHTGGCCVPYSLIEKAKIYMPNTEFRIVYGSTESCGTITIGKCNPENHIGQLVPNIDIKIVDEQSTNMGIGETGEICIRSIYPWAGYYKDLELTAGVYKDGWIHSGDLGYINEEGNLFVLDRKKDVIRYMENNIYPNELEMIIAEIPGVLDVCVCGLPNNNVGQLPAAAICKTKDSDLTAEVIYEYVAQRVEDYKKLRGGVFFANFIPKTRTGKNLRHRATNICEAQREIQHNEVTKL